MKKSWAKAILSILLAVLVALAGFFGFNLYNKYIKPTDFSDVKKSESGKGTGYFRHCYEELNENEQLIYDIVVSELYSQPEKIEIPVFTNEDLNKIFEAVSYDNPDLFNIGRNCKTYTQGYKNYFTVEYVMEYDTYRNYRETAEKVAADIVKDASVYKSEYDREKFVHDYLVEHTQYVGSNTSEISNTMYGCLVDGKASCEGYSRAFQYIMNELGIDNRLVTGESASNGINYIPHMWNFVVLDGNGYFVDVTWDDPEGSSPMLLHTYLNASTPDIMLKHRNIEQTLPYCDSKEYNYFHNEGKFLLSGSGEEFEAMVEACVYQAISQNKNCAEFRFVSAPALEQAKQTLFTDGVLHRIYKDAGLTVSEEGIAVYYVDDPTMCTLTVFF